MKKIGIFSIFTIALLGCAPQSRTENRTLYVSILPLRTIVGGIVGDDFQIEVLVPPGASPETFEPTPKQFAALNEARLVFNVGLIDFENSLLSKVADTSKIVDLSHGVALITGSCSHSSHGHRHVHGIDPHIWTSPRELQTMASNAYEAIRRAFPDSTKYEARYEVLQAQLQILDSTVNEKITANNIKRFFIYHPALTYYARAYDLEQVAVEDEGKEPSAKRMGVIIKQAREEGIRRIFYQRQFPVSTVETIARDINGIPTEIDPLREDLFINIMEITNLITSKQ